MKLRKTEENWLTQLQESLRNPAENSPEHSFSRAHNENTTTANPENGYINEKNEEQHPRENIDWEKLQEPEWLREADSINEATKKEKQAPPSQEKVNDNTQTDGDWILETTQSPAGEIESWNWKPREKLGTKLIKQIRTPAIVAASAIFITAGIAVALGMLTLNPGTEIPVQQNQEKTQNQKPLKQNETTHIATYENTKLQPSHTREQIYVHITGEINSPGLYKLAEGDRVADAIKQAGGTTPEAQLETLNIARKLNDGEQVHVQNKNQTTPETTTTNPENTPQTANPQTNTLNINTANVEQLATLPRVGPALAKRIIEWRTKNGSFTNIDQLLEISGIGEKTLTGFKDRLRL